MRPKKPSTPCAPGWGSTLRSDPIPGFLADLSRGDLGGVDDQRHAIRDQVAYNLPFTIELTLAALIVGIRVGAYGGHHHRGRTQPCARLHWAGSCPCWDCPCRPSSGHPVSLLFGVQLKWLPAVARPSQHTH